MKKLLVSLLILGTTALYFGQTVTSAVFTDVIQFTGDGTNNLFQTNAILPPGNPITIVSSSAANPTTVTTSGSNNYLTNGDTVIITGHSLGAVNGTWVVSAVTATSFQISVLGGGTGGTMARPITATVQAANGGSVDITAAQTPSTFATGHRIYRSPATPFPVISSSSGGAQKTGITSASGTTTTVTATSHGLSNGATVTITGFTGGAAAANGTWVISGVTANTFVVSVTTSGAGSGGTETPQATLTTTSAHRFQVGDTVVVSGHTGSTPALGGRYVVSTVASTTTFAIPVALTAAGSGGLTYRADPIIGISISSVANPTTVTTTSAHGLTTGDYVYIGGHTGSTPAISGYYQATVTGTTTFTIPVNVTVGGSGGQVYKASAQQTILTSANSGSPTTITTGSPHGLTTGDKIAITGHSVGGVNGIWTVTVLTSTTFTVPVASAGGTGGSIVRAMSSVISTSSVASATVITTPAPHGLVSGDTVFITGHGGSTPNVYGSYTATVTSGTTFTVPVNVTVAGSGGQFYRVANANIVSSSVATVTSITSSTAANPTTVTAASNPGLINGQTVFIAGHSNNSVNGTWVVSNVSGNTFQVSVLGGGTGGRVSTGTTVTTALPHRLAANDKVYVTNHDTATPPLAGQYTVAAIGSGGAPTTFVLNVDITIAGTGGAVTGPWSQVGSDISPLANVSANDASAGQGVFFYTVRGFYSGSGSIWESPNSNIVGASILNDFLVDLPDPQKATISTSSVANPTTITTSAAHGLTNGDLVTIYGHSGSTPSINGQYTITVTGASTFTIPVNVTVGGTGGTVERGQTAAISSSSVGNMTTITTATNHSLAVGDTVSIYGHTSTPSINGEWTVQAVPSGTTFTIATGVSIAGGATGRVSRAPAQTSGTNYTVIAIARVADGSTMAPFTGAATLTVASGSLGTISCTGGCSQSATAGVITYTEKFTDSPSNAGTPPTTKLRVSSNLAPVKTGDSAPLNVDPSTFTVSTGGNMKSGVANSSVTATAKDSAAATLTTFSGDVTIAVAPGSTGSITCTGGCTKTAVSGVATFTVTFSDAPYSTILRATYSSGSLTPIGDTAAFIVGPARFLVNNPATSTQKLTFSGLTATAKDSTGATASTFAGSVTAAPLVGTCTTGCSVTAASGIATFSAIAFSTPTNANTITATYTGSPSNSTGTNGTAYVKPNGSTAATNACNTASVDGLDATNPGGSTTTVWNESTTHIVKDTGNAAMTQLGATGSYQVALRGVGSATITGTVSLGTCNGATFTSRATGTVVLTFTTSVSTQIATFTVNTPFTLGADVLAIQVVTNNPTGTQTLTVTMDGQSYVSVPTRVNGRNFFNLSGSGTSAGSTCNSGFNDLNNTNPGGASTFVMNENATHILHDAGTAGLTSIDTGTTTYTVAVRGTGSATITGTVALGTCNGATFTQVSTATVVLTFTTAISTQTATFSVSAAAALSGTTTLAVRIVTNNPTGTQTLTVQMDGTSYVDGPYR